jgi:UDP-N-acetylglucosamine diphosphorylase/glucosamine-1-phosphate N-acetyltransferase
VPALYLYDDAIARTFEPFALTRPVSELRAGTELIRRRWERALGAPAAGFVGAAHLADFEELDAPPAAPAVLPAGSIVANARAVVTLAGAPATGATVWTCDGRVAAVRLAATLPLERLRDGTTSLDALVDADARASAVTLPGRWVDEIWDFIGQLGAQLTEDIRAVGPTLDARSHDSPVIGDPAAVHVECGATIDPYVVFDTTAGPVLVRSGATVQSFTRVVGPCFVGPGATVVGDRISGCSIGEGSRVHGEISSSIVLGHANKSHDGFVGHSYLGRWVNLGAGTTTSNLKNTYGTVALWTPAGIRSSGLQFLGTFFGDHAKVGIGMRLTTGTVVGAGANVYDRMPPKHVAPFSWGAEAPYGTYDVEKFLEVAAHVMSRRHVTLGDGGRRQLRAAYRRASAER